MFAFVIFSVFDGKRLPTFDLGATKFTELNESHQSYYMLCRDICILIFRKKKRERNKKKDICILSPRVSLHCICSHCRYHFFKAKWHENPWMCQCDPPLLNMDIYSTMDIRTEFTYMVSNRAQIKCIYIVCGPPKSSITTFQVWPTLKMYGWDLTH